jgi:nucleoid DNA-binding protein
MNVTLNKDFSDFVASKIGVSKKDAMHFSALITEWLKEQLDKGNKVTIHGILSLIPSKVATRSMYNPLTKEHKTVAGYRKVKMRMSPSYAEEYKKGKRVAGKGRSAPVGASERLKAQHAAVQKVSTKPKTTKK